MLINTIPTTTTSANTTTIPTQYTTQTSMSHTIRTSRRHHTMKVLGLRC
jgi:hypothetical protein